MVIAAFWYWQFQGVEFLTCVIVADFNSVNFNFIHREFHTYGGKLATTVKTLSFTAFVFAFYNHIGFVCVCVLGAGGIII